MVRTFTNGNFKDIGKLDAVRSMNVFEKSPGAGMIHLVHPGAHNATI